MKILIGWLIAVCIGGAARAEVIIYKGPVYTLGTDFYVSAKGPITSWMIVDVPTKTARLLYTFTHLNQQRQYQKCYLAMGSSEFQQGHVPAGVDKWMTTLAAGAVSKGYPNTYDTALYHGMNSSVKVASGEFGERTYWPRLLHGSVHSCVISDSYNAITHLESTLVFQGVPTRAANDARLSSEQAQTNLEKALQAAGYRSFP